MSNFSRLADLPARSATRQEFYDLAETLVPGAGLVDDGGGNTTIKVSANDTLVCEACVPRWVKYTIDFDDDGLDVAAVSAAVDLFSLDAGGVIMAVKQKHSEAFAGGSITDLDVEVGISGTVDKYCGSFDVDQAVADGTFILNTIEHANDTSADAGGVMIQTAWTAVGDNLDALTAGSLDVWVLYAVAA